MVNSGVADRRLQSGLPARASRPSPIADDEAQARAREAFLTTGMIAAGVRPEISASWLRSVLSGFRAGISEPRFSPNMNFECQLMRAAKPILEDRIATLGEMGFAFVLTDAEVRVLHRLTGDDELMQRLTQANVLPGYCLDESLAGTNAMAMAIEVGGPADVHGPEHLESHADELSCVSAPIVHPVGRQVLGTLTLICHIGDANALLMPWLAEVISQIEQRLCRSACAHEQRLLECYLTARRNAKHPVVCLNERTILSNSAAARLLGPDDQALLWEQASRSIADRADDTSTMVLANGQEILAECRPIYEGLTPVGAKIEIRLNQKRAPRRSRSAPVPAPQGLAPLAGRGPRWQRLCAEVAAAKALGQGVLLVGESGTGKLSVARALFAEQSVHVFDAALHSVGGSGDWVGGLCERLKQPEGVVVLQHLESLDVFTARTVTSLLDRLDDAGPTIVGTLTCRDGAPRPHEALLDRIGSVVEVPALRDRLEDLRDLLEVLTSRHVAQGAQWRWMPDAVQTLVRVDWPSNLNTLEHVVKQIVPGRSGGYVDTRRLPDWVRAAASRRQLSRLEQLEAGAITVALAQAKWNKLEAAKNLGIARSTLYRRMRTLGITLAGANY